MRQHVSEALTYGTRGAGTGILAFWGGGLELVSDNVSQADKGIVTLTAMTFGNIIWRVTQPYKRVSFLLS